MDTNGKTWQWLLKNGVDKSQWPAAALNAWRRFSGMGLRQNGLVTSRAGRQRSHGKFTR